MHEISMEGFYDWMKQCLKFFDVRFGDMEKVNLKFEENKITAIYENEAIMIMADPIEVPDNRLNKDKEDGDEGV